MLCTSSVCDTCNLIAITGAIIELHMERWFINEMANNVEPVLIIYWFCKHVYWHIVLQLTMLVKKETGRPDSKHEKSIELGVVGCDLVWNFKSFIVETGALIDDWRWGERDFLRGDEFIQYSL